MVIKTSSPGVVVNEFDLTRGTSDAITTNVACVAGPFEKGPVDKITLVENEVDFQETFGNPTDENYEYWYSVDNFLEYGGVCYVVRCDDSTGGDQLMKNAADGPRVDDSGNVISYYVKNEDDFEENFFNVEASQGGLPAKFIAKSPGEWANSLAVAVIDHGADHEMTLFRDQAYTIAGTPLAGDSYFNKATELGSVVGSYYSVAATPEEILQPAEFAPVRTTVGYDFSVAQGGIFGFTSVNDAGNGYGLRDAVDVTQTTSGGSGTGLTLLCTISGGQIVKISGIVDLGSGYKNGDVVSFDGGATRGSTAEITSVSNLPSAGVSATVVDGGTGYTNLAGADVIGGSGTGLTVSLTTADGVIQSATVVDGGDGYVDGEAVIVDGGNGDGILMVQTDTNGVVSGVRLLTGGEDHTAAQAGTAKNASTFGGSGTGMKVDYVTDGSAISAVTIVDPGVGYQATDTINIRGGNNSAEFELVSYSNGTYGGILINDGDRVLLRGQTDASENGIYVANASGAWGRSTDADASGDFVSGKIVPITEGTFAGSSFQYTGTTSPSVNADAIDFEAYSPITPLGSGDVARVYDPQGNFKGALAYVMEVKNGVYRVMSVTGEIGPNDTLTKDNTNFTGSVSEVEYIGRHVLYSYSAKDEGGNFVDERIVNTIFDEKKYSYEEGLEKGWPAPIGGKVRPAVNGARAVSTLGNTFVFSTSTQTWNYLYEPKQGDAVNDGTNIFVTDDADDWYKKQVAFQGIPWNRFAPRPGTSPRAADSGSSLDEMHIIVYDRTGELTGSKGNTLENYYGLSKMRLAKTPEGDNNYYVDVINRRSANIFANSPVDGPSLTEINELFDLSPVGTNIGDGVVCEFIEPMSYELTGGENQLVASLGELQNGYQKFVDENVEDLDFVLQGPSMSNEDDSIAKANFVISIAEELRTCMAFISPPRYAAVEPMAADDITGRVVEFFDSLSSSSYSVFDSGYKYTYDRFNDKQRYVPLNADIAGLMVSTSINSEPWYSPAGVVRGQIRNVIRLSYNPSKEQRDQLFSARVNPVTTFPGEGTILYGDKTALAYSSAFDRINVRKLFLIIEKEIAKISRSVLFEFNDITTRSMFKNNVNPYLRDIQSRRGLTDFLVVCDESNNTPEVIDRNEFVADIYIKPNRSINFITLNFVATKTGVSFSEAVGLFRR